MLRAPSQVRNEPPDPTSRHAKPFYARPEENPAEPSAIETKQLLKHEAPRRLSREQRQQASGLLRQWAGERAQRMDTPPHRFARAPGRPEPSRAKMKRWVEPLVATRGDQLTPEEYLLL